MNARNGATANKKINHENFVTMACPVKWIKGTIICLRNTNCSAFLVV